MNSQCKEVRLNKVVDSCPNLARGFSPFNIEGFIYY